MRLSSCVGAAEITTCRDGSFENLGFIAEQRCRMLSFLENERLLPALLRNKNICAVLTTPTLAGMIPEWLALGISEEPRLSFAALHNGLAKTDFYWQDFPSRIDPGAEVHARAWIAERNVTIGPGSIIGANATILERSLVGSRVTIGAGVVLGGVGFQTARTPGVSLEMVHAGGLIIDDGCHILPGAVISTALFRDHTRMGREARIGAQSFLSHGVKVGDRSFVGHGSVINGNVVIHNDAWVGPGCVVSQNLTIGSKAFVSLGSVVIRDVGAGEQVSGNFAVPHRQFLRHLAKMESRRELK